MIRTRPAFLKIVQQNTEGYSFTPTQLTRSEAGPNRFIVCPHCKANLAKVTKESLRACFQKYWLHDGNLLHEAYEILGFDFDDARNWEVFWNVGGCHTCNRDYYVMEILTVNVMKNGDDWIDFHADIRLGYSTTYSATYNGLSRRVPTQWYVTEEEIDGPACLQTHYIGPFPAQTPALAAAFFVEIKNELLRLNSTIVEPRGLS